MQVIDEAYVRELLALPDGTERITRWIFSMIDEKDTAQAIASMCAKQVREPPTNFLEVAATAAPGTATTSIEAFATATTADSLTNSGFLEVEGTPDEAAQLLEWFSKRTDLDLKYVYDMEPSHIPLHLLKPGPIPEEGWCVHQEHGGRNDREWTLISIEGSAIGALREAHKAFCDGR